MHHEEIVNKFKQTICLLTVIHTWHLITMIFKYYNLTIIDNIKYLREVLCKYVNDRCHIGKINRLESCYILIHAVSKRIEIASGLVVTIMFYLSIVHHRCSNWMVLHRKLVWNGIFFRRCAILFLVVFTLTFDVSCSAQAFVIELSLLISFSKELGSAIAENYLIFSLVRKFSIYWHYFLHRNPVCTTATPEALKNMFIQVTL